MPGSQARDQSGHDQSRHDTPSQDPPAQGPPDGLDTDHDTIPPADRRLLAVAGVLLLLPIVALMWVGSYARIEPKLAGFPFFFWYQFLWVFLCSSCTYASYRLVLKARPHRPMTGTGTRETGAGR